MSGDKTKQLTGEIYTTHQGPCIIYMQITYDNLVPVMTVAT